MNRQATPSIHPDLPASPREHESLSLSAICLQRHWARNPTARSHMGLSLNQDSAEDPALLLGDGSIPRGSMTRARHWVLSARL